MDMLLGVGAAVGSVAVVTVGALIWRRNQQPAIEPAEPATVALQPDIANRVAIAYADWLFRLQGNCPWCRGGQFRSVNRTMKLDIRDGSLKPNVSTRCSRCKWIVDAEPEAAPPNLLVATASAVAAEPMTWSVETASGSPIAEVSVGGGKGVEVQPSAEASASSDPRIDLAATLFRGACSVDVPGLAGDALRVERGAAVQARIVRARVVGMPRTRSVPPRPA
jgi:hypothetical protein